MCFKRFYLKSHITTSELPNYLKNLLKICSSTEDLKGIAMDSDNY